MRRMLVATMLMLTLPSFLTHATAAPLPSAPDFDLAAIVLTMNDFETEGFDGYRIERASQFDLAETASFISDTQHLSLPRVTQTFENAGNQGSYFTMFNLRSDYSNLTSPPQRGIETGVYLFDDEPGALAGYTIITDEDNLSNATDLDDAGKGLGDASEMTLYTLHSSPSYGVPTTQLELEIRLGRLVLEVSTFDYEEGTAGTKQYEADEPANLEALGQRLIERANAALSSDHTNLSALLLPIETSVPKWPYRTYTLLDGDPIQENFESDQAVRDRASGQLDRDTESIIFMETIVHDADSSMGTVRVYNGIYQFENSSKASAYLNGLVDRLSKLADYSSVEAVDAPDLGDGALVVEFTFPGDGSGETKLNQLYVRDGALVATIWMQEDPLTPDSPLFSVETLEELGAVQADCLAAGACDSTVPLPDGAQALLPAASDGGRAHLPETTPTGDTSEPTVDDLLARIEIFTNLSREHTDGPVDYEQNPPVGGMHNPVLQNCGFYSEPVGNEHAVHSLEHGAVWITYDPDLPASDIAKLKALVEGHDYLLISPYEGLPSPVVASAWGVQLQLDGVDDPYLIAFINYYEQGPQTPEPGALCSGGTSETVG